MLDIEELRSRFMFKTFVITASGPSLSSQDVSFCKNKANVLCVNDSFSYAPWADVLYACDADWWHDNENPIHGKAYKFPGLKFSLRQTRYPDVHLLKEGGMRGINFEWPYLNTGQNSGYQAINLAIHFGAKRIVLLGFDMQFDGKKKHFFGNHTKLVNPSPRQLKIWIDLFGSMKIALQNTDIEIINCSRRTNLNCFSRQKLEDVL